jgi:hypothetical protein
MRRSLPCAAQWQSAQTPSASGAFDLLFLKILSPKARCA